MTRLFISHSSHDDDFVRDLRAALADHGLEGWIDSRELRGGDALWPEIQQAMENASAYVVLVSPQALQSTWVSRELRYALSLANRRGRDKFPIIPLSLNGTQLGVLEEILGGEVLYVPVSSEAGGVEAAINTILVALGQRLAADNPSGSRVEARPLEELVLELTDLKLDEHDGKPWASARARLVYEPATPGQPHVSSVQTWCLIAPPSPIEAAELRWYLEKYAIWPGEYFRHRARNVEESLVMWGQLLYRTAMPAAHTANVVDVWANIDKNAARRFSVYVDATLEAGAAEADIKAAREAAVELLKMPWELLHDGNGYLFQGAKPTRVRRRLPNTQALNVPVVAPPIRILLVSPRPEDGACGYIDHRESALALVEAMESLPGLVKIHVLSPPTLPALREELDRAREEDKPYQVIHFDGHGVYNTRIGLGGLCFELPEDIPKLEKRRHVTVYTQDSTDYGTGLGSLLRDHRIPLVFLEACQTAQAEKASESVASELLKVGVASVVAMSHSVLVETARRFVEAFYRALAAGKRVGDAMLAGQRQLKDDTFRGRVFGAGELRLEDWFVPVLFQEKDDPQLFSTTPAKQTQADFQVTLTARLGQLPPVPQTGFVGRSRELLALQRLLRHERYAVVRGQGGEGKTALAAELARWMVRSHQIRRAAFVSVETHSSCRAVVDVLGRQLVRKDFSAVGDLEEVIQEVERALREQSTLLVVDNMESILLPPWLETAEAPPEDVSELDAILKLCARLNALGDTRLIFTSREALPAPFESERHRRELRQMETEDAVKLIERVLNAAGPDAGDSSDAAREEIEQLVEAVHCHARTLALLAPALRNRGVEATRESLVELMADMENRFPGSRDKSVFASVELSLRRLSDANRRRVHALAGFHGAVHLGVLRDMMEWTKADVSSLGDELIETGLATRNRHGHLTLNPALCPYLRGRMDVEEPAELMSRWDQVMVEYVQALLRQRDRNPELAATLMSLDLPNFLALLHRVQRTGDLDAIVELATSLHSLLQYLGKPKLLEFIGRVRDTAAAKLNSAWDHVRFSAASARVNQHIGAGQLLEAQEGAQELLRQARAAGERAYPNADYDLATACWLVARVWRMTGDPAQALLLLQETRQRFEAVPKERAGRAAEQMAAACFSEQGDCLRELGRFDEAEAAYEENILRAQQLDDARQVAIAKNQLGLVYLSQQRYPEALAVHAEARALFAQLDEPAHVAAAWHQIGMVYQTMSQPEDAEDAYRESLAISVRIENVVLQANTLVQLGTLYNHSLGRSEEAVVFCREGANKYAEIHDTAREGAARFNLAATLGRLRRFDEARVEILRVIECHGRFGHAAQPWLNWELLAQVETDSGNTTAAEEARAQAVASYLAYRRAGGENHDFAGRIVFQVVMLLRSRGTDAVLASLQEIIDDPELANSLAFSRALQAIVAGGRDRALVDGLRCIEAAELLFLIESLEKSA